MNNQLEEFINLLNATMSPDNVLRREAESRFESISSDLKIALLLEVLMKATDSQVVEISALLLRQEVGKLSSCQSITETTLLNLKNTLPQLCLQQPKEKIRHKFVDILSSLILLDQSDKKNTWGDALPFVYNCLITLNNDLGKDIGFRILEACPYLMNDLTEEMFRNVFHVINAVFSNHSSCSQSILEGCIKSFSTILIELPQRKVQPVALQSLQLILNLLSQTTNDSILVGLLTELSIILECKPSILKCISYPLVESLLKILNSNTTQESIRLEAMECIATYCEHRKKVFTSPPVSNLLNTIVEAMIKHIALIPENDAWYTKYNDSDDEDMEISVCGETCLDRITCAIGGKVIFPIIMSTIAPLFQSEVWQYRCAALITIGCIAEGCRKVLKPYLPRVIETIVPYIKDTSPRVVFYTINTLGQLAVDYCGHFHSQYHQQIFPIIFYASDAYPNFPRVRAHAICCYNNLLDGCPPAVLDIYSDEFFSRLRTLLLTIANQFNLPESPFLLQNIMSSLTKFSDSRGKDFSKYYSVIIPELLSLAKSFPLSTQPKLFISTIELISSVLIAVGKDICFNELNSVLEIIRLSDIQNIKSDESENLQLDYLDIMANLSEVFDESFSVIAQQIIPSLIELASVPIDNSLISAINVDKSGDRQEQAKLFSAHTEILQERQKICSIIEHICTVSPSSVSGYIERLTRVILDLLNNTLDPDLQESVFRILACILKIALGINQNSALVLWVEIFDNISKKISVNPMTFNNDVLYFGLRSCIKEVSYTGLSNDLLLKIVELLNIEFTRLSGNASISLASTKEDDLIDEEDDDYCDMDDDDDSDVSVLESLAKLIRTLFKLLKTGFYPYFMKMSEKINILCGFTDPYLRCWVLTILTSVVEFCPNESVQISSIIIPLLSASLTDKNSSFRQTGFYCVGIMAQFASSQYQGFVSNAIPTIVSNINSQDSRNNENATATANAIAAIGKIMKYCPNLISPFQNAVLSWLGWLPVCDDEVSFILSYLVEIVETNGQLIFSSTNSNIFYKTLDSIAVMVPYVDDDVSKRVVNLLSKLKAHMPEPFDQWYKNLDSSLRENVEYVITSNT